MLLMPRSSHRNNTTLGLRVPAVSCAAAGAGADWQAKMNANNTAKDHKLDRVMPGVPPLRSCVRGQSVPPLCIPASHASLTKRAERPLAVSASHFGEV